MGKPAIVLAAFLLLFGGLQFLIPLRTAVQIGAHEGFELAKAMLCLKGYRLYSDVWNDQPPLHTFLITQAVRLLANQPVTPSLSPSDSGRGVSPVRLETHGRDARATNSVLGPCLVTVGFAALLLISVFTIIRREAAEQLLPMVEDEGWFFDTELLVLAQRHGRQILDVPVPWLERTESRVELVSTILGDLRGLFALRRRLGHR